MNRKGFESNERREVRISKETKRALKVSVSDLVFIVTPVLLNLLVPNLPITPVGVRSLRCLLCLSLIVACRRMHRWSRSKRFSGKRNKFIAIFLLILQLKGPALSLSRLYPPTTEAYHSYIVPKSKSYQLAFDYNEDFIRSLHKNFLVARERLVLISKTRTVREHLPLTVLGVAHTYRGVQHYLAGEKMIGVAEVAFGGCLVTRPCFPKKMQGNKNLLIATGIALSVVDIHISYNLEKKNFYEALEQQQKELSLNENKLRYLHMVLKDQDAQSAEDNQHFVFMLAQQKSLLVENHKKEINQKTTECNKKINNHFRNVEALDKMLKTCQTKAKMQDEVLEKCQKDHERL